MPDRPASEGAALSPGAGQTPPTPRPKFRWRSFLGRWSKRIGIFLGIFLFLFGILVLFAEHKTSKPEFCGSCHIMETYYSTWHSDVHGGKLDIACVECHYAPGERNTLTAKLRGLSQVASYVSGRYGQSRPRAHVDNRSCLTSRCHGDLRFMDKELKLGTVTFTHAKHLQHDAEKQEKTQVEMGKLTEVLRPLLGDTRFKELSEVASETGPAKQRRNRMKELVKGWGVPVKDDQLSDLTQLNHREVRLAQLKDLQCTNCHSYVAPEHQVRKEGVEPRHFTTKTTACYTCHFNNEGFNSGTASCLLCHTLPTKEITIHEKTTSDVGKALKTPELAEKPVRMDHRMILERKVQCISCHADVTTQNPPVTRRDCERCHDRAEYFKDWKEPLSLTLAQKYHEAHVPEQRAKCIDCHAEIQHHLVRGKTDSGQPNFLKTVLSDCVQCHRNPHIEQLELLSGQGGVGVPKGDPNMMFGMRTNCLGCHVEEGATKSGGVALQGTLSGCVSCHGDRHSKTFEQWKQGVKVYLMDAEEAYEKARGQFEKAKDLKPETRTQLEGLLRGMKADLMLVKRGNGVHNVMYSLELLESITKRSQRVVALLTAK